MRVSYAQISLRSVIDASRALHRIIAQRIGSRRIVDDDADRDAFIDRLGTILNETDTACFTWL